MPVPITTTSKIIGEHFQDFEKSFHQIARSARQNFINRDWEAQRKANAARISLHREKVEEAYQALLKANAIPVDEDQVLSRLIDYFIANYASQAHAILAYGYVDALLRKILYRHKDFAQVYTTREYPFPKNNCHELVTLDEYELPLLIRQMLEKTELEAETRQRAVEDGFILSQFKVLGARGAPYRISYLPNLFYRNQHAYLLGMFVCGERQVPFAIAFINPSMEGLMADAVLVEETYIKRIFAFSRSYLLYDTSDPYGVIQFLLQLMPSKTEEQLIINLGYQDAGRHRMLQKLKMHLRSSTQKFNLAPGIPGMVMLVFCLPDYPLVFKLIRDDIKPPKSIRKEQVLEKYDFVARHDRAGRLADVQLYDYLVLPLSSFEAAFLTDLQKHASRSVMIRGDYIILKQVFVERKMRPLNLFLREAPAEAQQKATLDYGRAIKEMAMINIFPGDLLIKNFGVTRDDRVVFYDYDEVCTLQDCEFRKMPQARYEDEIMSAEAWFSVNEHDVFPEEFASFTVPKGPLFRLFSEHYGEIFNADFWNHWKQYHASGKVLDLQPYEGSRYERQLKENT